MELQHIESLCRVCLKLGDFPLFNDSEDVRVCDKIALCTKAEIADCDGLPKLICATCINELSVAYNFVLKWEESMKVLHKLSQTGSVQAPSTPEVSLKQEGDSNSCDNDDCGDDKPIDVIKDQIETNNSKVPVKSRPRVRYIEKKTKKAYKKRESGANQCPYCGKMFSFRSVLEVHVRKHTGEKPFPCSQCKAQFSQNSLLKRHFESRHNTRERKFMCETCGMKFFTENCIKIHKRRHTGEKPHTCPHCSQKFTQLSALTRHKRTHTKEKQYSCPVCFKTFASSSSVTCHMTVHSNDKNFSCHFCNQAFKCKKNLRAHIKRHTDPINHTCHYCGSSFSAKGNLKKHIEHMHSEKSGNCKICGKSVPDLEVHMIRHSGQQLYKCDHCNKSFSIYQSLLKHKSYKHVNVLKYKCSITNCDKTFPVLSMLEFHMLKYHKNQTPFICSHCSRGFFRLSDLSRHLKLTHNEVMPKTKKKNVSIYSVNQT